VTLKVGMQVLRMTHRLKIVTICGKYLQNSMKKLWTGHKIYPVTDYDNLLPQKVALTLEVGNQLLRMTYRLIIVSNCGKYLQIPSKITKL
jgi:hypothetical protein